ncbi:extracellular matrix regulator RemB [Bacillus marasmi]|uniref:extracellular matrix regulator RemB n=1 Tax=Bacillus marasmi TaxID=1926279 RepID=UPI0011C85FAA|nr:extracellular matrix/biofilm biosynthesis regulator RemA family protein [Bacillus marasmi]
MYLHVGEEITVHTKEIIAIIDKHSIRSSPLMEKFIQQRKDQIINLTKGNYKSVVITSNKVYFSPFSSGTLKKRSKVLFNHD